MLNKSFNISLLVWIKACLNHLVVKAIGKENMLDFSYLKNVSVFSSRLDVSDLYYRWGGQVRLWLCDCSAPDYRKSAQPWIHIHCQAHFLTSHTTQYVQYLHTTFRSVFTRVCSQCAITPLPPPTTVSRMSEYLF